jgi:hypothetical protein
MYLTRPSLSLPEPPDAVLAQRTSRAYVGDVLAPASPAREAQLLLSLLVWPEECPDPRVVDEWVRCGSVPHSCPKRAHVASEALRMDTSPESTQRQ